MKKTIPFSSFTQLDLKLTTLSILLRWKCYIVLLTFAALICACDSNIELTPNTIFGSCLQEEQVSDFSIQERLEESNFQLDSTIFCEQTDVDTPFLLSEEDKEWLPQYCLEEGDMIYYSNGREEVGFRLEEKTHNLRFQVYRQDTCELDGRNKLYHTKQEEATLLFYSDDLSMSLGALVKADISFDTSFPTSATSSIGFYSSTAQDSFGVWVVREIPKNGDTFFSTNGEYHEEINLNGRIFYDVYEQTDTYFTGGTRTSSYLGGISVLYYNKDFSVVGFSDNDDVLWVIN